MRLSPEPFEKPRQEPKPKPEEPIADIEALLGPPVTVIEGVKIYDTESLLQPPIRLQRYEQIDKRFKYLRQVNGQLSHIFIRDAKDFIARRTEVEQKTEGLLPPLNLAISTLKTVFVLLYGPVLSRADENFNVRIFYANIIHYVYPTLNLAVDQLINQKQVSYDLASNDNEYEFLKDVSEMIKLTYDSLGYEFSYFGPVKKNHPLRMAKTGRVPLRPDTFEAFGLFHLAPAKFIDMDNAINVDTVRGGRLRKSCFDHFNTYVAKTAGWQKKDLVAAIKRSGLWRNISNLKREGKDKLNETMGIPFKSLGLADPNPQQQIVRGLAKTAYMPHCYYEALYRKVYSTNDYINWPFLCELGAIPVEKLRQAAVSFYQAKPEQVINASADELCFYVTDISRRRRETTKSLALAAQEATEGFVARPGSRWVQPTTLQRRGPLGEFITPPSNDYQLYVAVKQYCEDQKITKEQMIGYTEALNIRSYLPDNLERYSKEDLCDYLLDFLLPRAQKYENVLADCDDPAIGVRQILNAATIMELDGIFPKDVTNLTKTEACQIIANYIKLLRQRV